MVKQVALLAILISSFVNPGYAEETIKRKTASTEEGILFLRIVSGDDSPDPKQVTSDMQKEIQGSCELDSNFTPGCHKIRTKLSGPSYVYECYVKVISCNGNTCPKNWYFNEVSYRCQDRPIEGWVGGNPRIRDTDQ